MRVDIVGGRAGRLMEQILPQVRVCHEQGIPVVLLVPQQYTLQAERELVSYLQLPGLMDIEVLSPQRLTRRIRENGGHSGLMPLDAAGRSMALSQALTMVQDELVYYRRVALAPTLPDRMGVLIADMQRAGVTAQELRDHAAAMPQGALQAKENDVALVWQTYLDLVDGRFADETMQQQDTVRRVKASRVLDGVALFVYGFDVLPASLCALLTEAADVLNSLTVTMTMDAADAPDGRIFLTQRHSAHQLMEMLQERQIRVSWRYLPIKDAPDQAPALRHVERHLFTRQGVVFDGDASPVQVHAAATPFAEAVYIANTLRAWHDAGTPWQHMAVAMADVGSMAGILAVTLKAAGIPHYVAREDSAARHGLCRMLLGALRAATGGYATQDVLTMMKSGFSPLAEEEAHALENYALQNGIDHKRWLTPFTRGAFEAMEPLREKLIAPVETLRGELREAKTATQSAEAIYRLLENVSAYERLLQRENELLSRGLQAEAAQNRQVWQMVMNLLDQLHALLGDRRAAMKDVARFVTSGLTGATINSLPPQPDEVMLGEAGHLLTGRIDALVVCGMQDGVLGSTQDSLISEAERRVLSDAMHRPIGLTKLQTAALRQSDFYRTMALPRHQLLVTFAQGGQDGAALRPSGLVEDMQTMFPTLVVTGGVSGENEEEAPLSPQLALDGLAPRLRALADGEAASLSPAWEEALRRLWHHPDWHEKVQQVMAGAVDGQRDAHLPPQMTRQLLLQDMVSISRLEKFAACPYQHYVDYGLKPVPREKWAFEANDAGEFYHAALQGFAHAALQHPDWPDLDDEAIDGVMDEVLAPLTAAWQDGPLSDTPAQALQGEKYVRTVKRAAWLFMRQARSSRFKTVGEEVVFGEGGLPPVVLHLPDGQRIGLRGKIDRVDRWEGDDGVYLRVIDYKSSRRDIDPTRLWYGLQLQLMLYLQAAAQGMHGDPAGAFYFAVRDPLVDAQDAKEAAEKAIAKQLQLKGVVLSDVQVVNAMDADGTALGTVFTKSGGVSAYASAYSREEMAALLDHTRHRAEELAQGILDGDIAVQPAQMKDWKPCQYCEYSAVCGIDPTLPHCHPRKLNTMTRQELQQKLSNHTDTEA